MPALGAPELIIILVIIVLIFGVGKLPEVGQALGKGIREFRSATDDEKEKEKEQAAASSTAAVEAANPPTAIPPPSAQPAPVAQPAAAAQPAPAPQPAAAVRPAPVNGSADYTVQAGDTLDSVAQRHGVTVEALMEANGYSQRDRVLYPGDRLLLPRSTSATS